MPLASSTDNADGNLPDTPQLDANGNPIASADSTDALQDSISSDPKSREYYLQQIPLTAEEAERILSGSVGGAPKRRAKVAVGDNVRIVSGAFEDYAGKVISIDSAGARVQVDIEGTPIDIEIDQVELI